MSPLSSGGAGTIFEYRVAAIFLARLLCSAHVPGFQVPVTRVGLQQGVRGHHLDDIVIFGGSGSLRTEFQVKQTLTVTASDDEFAEVVTQGLHAIGGHLADVRSGDLAIGLVAEGESTPLKQLEQLAAWAGSHSEWSSFAEYMQEGVIDAKKRSRLDHVKKAVGAAITAGAPDLGGLEATVHMFLRALHVWRPAVWDDGVDYLATLDQLKPVAKSLSVSSADLFGHLLTLVEEWGPHGGVVDGMLVRQRLRRRGLTDSSIASLPVSEIFDVDAIVRGPLEALNLQDERRRADAALRASDPAAADMFGAIAEKLKAARFIPDAVVLWRQRANALRALERHDEAAIARIGLAWDELDRVRIYEAGFALHDGFRDDLQVSAAVQRALTAAEAAVQVAKGAPAEGIAEAFDSLQADDAFAANVAAFLCEEAIAAAQPQLITDRLDALTSVAVHAAEASDTRIRLLAVRIQMCLADASGQWDLLLRSALRVQPRNVVAWLHARYARYCALSGNGSSAQEHYLEAIERATAEKMLDDAADWLYDLRTVRFWYSIPAHDEQHPRAQAMRPHATPSGLPGSTHTSELALRAALDEEKPAEAMQRVRRWLWQATIRGHLTEELDACGKLAALLRRRGDLNVAVLGFIRSGSGDKASATSKELTSSPRLDPKDLSDVPIRRVAMFRAATSAFDLIGDDVARAWASAALEQAEAGYRQQGMTGRTPYEAAFDLLAVSCTFLDADQTLRLIRILEPLIHRESGATYRTDEATMRILIALSLHREDLVPLVIRMYMINDQAATILNQHQEWLLGHRDQVLASLMPIASDNQNACTTIVLASADPHLAAEPARKWVTRCTQPRQRARGVLTWEAGGADIAILASVLEPEERARFAATMLERALDRTEVSFTRRNDLIGLLNIAGDLDRATQVQLLPQVIEIALGNHDQGATFGDEKISLGPLGLHCAMKLDPDETQTADVEDAAIAALQNASASDQWHIIRALVLIPAALSRLDVRLCAAHPFAGLRCVAGIRWAKDSTVLPTARALALAQDPDFVVRREFARALTDHPNDSHRDVIALLATDAHRTVRTMASRPVQPA